MELSRPSNDGTDGAEAYKMLSMLRDIAISIGQQNNNFIAMRVRFFRLQTN
jgi:hypothetical protein